MPDIIVSPGDRSKRLYILGRSIAVGLGIVSGSISLAFGVHRMLPLIVDYGAAIIVEEVIPIGVYQKGGRVGFQFEKRRACDPKTATITVPGNNGDTIIGIIDWRAPFPVKQNISAMMRVDFPAGIPPGYYRNVTAEIWHWRCADGGGDPRKPVTVAIPNFLVSD